MRHVATPDHEVLLVDALAMSEARVPSARAPGSPRHSLAAGDTAPCR